MDGKFLLVAMVKNGNMMDEVERTKEKYLSELSYFWNFFPIVAILGIYTLKAPKYLNSQLFSDLCKPCFIPFVFIFQGKHNL